MIYVDIYYIGEVEDEKKVGKVLVTYPNEEDFMKERIKEAFYPYNHSLKVEIGVYDGSKGFFPDILRITGGQTVHEVALEYVIKRLPNPSCIITSHFNWSDEED